MKRFYIGVIILLMSINLYGQSGTVKYWVYNDNIAYKKEFNLKFNKNKSLMVFDLKPFSYKTKERYKISSKGRYNAVYIDTKLGEATIYRRSTGRKKKTVKIETIANKKKWIIHEEYKTILGYKVQKATLSYKYIQKAAEGNYGEIEVWFAVDIPVDAGPNSNQNLDYVIHGLPGLVLKVDFLKSPWRFEAFDIQLSKEEILLEMPKEAIKISKKEFWAAYNE